MLGEDVLATRPRLGPVPWFVLEELLRLAPGRGGLVETSVRELAANLSLNKDTVARALVRLRAEGIVIAQRQGHTPAGRFGRTRYTVTLAARATRFARAEDLPARRNHARLVTSERGTTGAQQLTLLDVVPGCVPAAVAGPRANVDEGCDALAPGVPSVPAVDPSSGSPLPDVAGGRPC